jgi:anion-transporting  ArsA/GET3 family ATPase
MNTNQPSTKRVDVIASLSMESLIRSLELPFDLRYSSEQVSLESQQMDEQQRLDTLAAHHENLKKLLKAEKPTGTPQLFVLDPEQLAVGDLDASTTLHALATQQFSNARYAAVAMLAPESGYTVAGQAAATMIQDNIVKNMGVVSIESLDGLMSWFNTL